MQGKGEMKQGPGRTVSSRTVRAAALGEVHARPFAALQTPTRVLHFAFTTDAAGSAGRAGTGETLRGARRAAAGPGQAHPDRTRAGHADLRAARRISDLRLGLSRRDEAVRSRADAADGRDAPAAAAGPLLAAHGSASASRRRRARRSDEPFQRTLGRRVVDRRGPGDGRQRFPG